MKCRINAGFFCADNTDPFCLLLARQLRAMLKEFRFIQPVHLLQFMLPAALCAELPLALAQAPPAPAPPQAQSFQAAIAKALENHGTKMGVAGLDGWIFFDKELRHLSSPRYWSDPPAPSADSSDPLPAILDFKAQLDKAGIELLVLPVPTKAAIYPDKLAKSLPAPPETPAGLAEQDSAFLEVLRSHGVDVLDLTRPFLEARAEGVETHCRTDTHWSPEGVRIAAREVAAKVSERLWANTSHGTRYLHSSGNLRIQGDLAPPNSPPEALPARIVSHPATAESPGVQSSKSSPIVLLGDSHNLIFHAGGSMHATGSGLPDHLASELGFPVDVVAVMGSGATPARRSLARRKDNLDGKKLVIWCFSAREFTQGQGWAKVQVIKDPATSSPTPATARP